MKKCIVFLDMDGVLADFDSAVTPDHPDPPEMYVPGFYKNLKVMSGAHLAVHTILGMKHIELYIGTKQSTGLLSCSSEKVEWIAINFPKLLKKMVMVCDKGLLRGDVLIDDCPELWKHKFEGMFFTFDKKNPIKAWDEVVKTLKNLEDLFKKE